MVLDGYIRVSQVNGRKGERFISAKVQREQIVAWTRVHDATLGEVFEELDESGARSDRPLLTEAIGRIERGNSAGLVVAKLDRFGRSVSDGLRAIQRIEQAGGTFVSVQDGFDLGTSTGRLVLQVLLSIGEWELERVRSNWAAARERAISRGTYIPAGPLGYRKGRDGRLRIEPREALVVREIFERRAAGDAHREIAARLNERGQRTRRGRPFRSSTLSRIIQNPAYRGEAYHGEHRNPGAHEPIVDRALWQLCQQTPQRRREADRSLLGGLVRCARCGRLMTSESRPPSGPPSHFVYCCGMSEEVCAERAYARADELDPLLEEFLFGAFGRPATDASEEMREREAEVEAAEAELLAYRDEPAILAALGAASFAEGLAARRQRLERSLAKLGRAMRRQGAPSGVATLAAQWPELDCTERAAALARFVECVVIDPGRAPLIERVRVFRPGEAPIWRVHRRLVIASESLERGGERLPRPRRWPAARLEAELRGFLAQRGEWPRYREFAEAGRARLFSQALAYGGPYYWGPRLGVRVPPSCIHWNRERIRGALAPLLEGRSQWPVERQFRQAGMIAVYHAVRNHGGIRYWAAQFGCSCRSARITRWPEERIGAELAKFASARPGFPTRSEFEAAGQRSLYEAIRRKGGIASWAARLELARGTGRLKDEAAGAA